MSLPARSLLQMGLGATNEPRRSNPLAVRLELPWPPSVNTIWRTLRSGRMAGRTLLSEKGRQYRTAVNDQVTLQSCPRNVLAGSLWVLIDAYPPDKRARDLDNLLKAPLDALVHAKVISDDRYIDFLRIWRREVVPGGRCIVRIEEEDPSTSNMRHA